jgi:hypothetical protein
MDIDPTLIKQATPGVLGSGAAMLFIRGPWSQRLAMVIPGAALSYYAAAHLAQTVHMPEGLAGFLLGLFGMAMVAKVFETWESLQLGPLIQRFLAKRLGLGDDEKGTP